MWMQQCYLHNCLLTKANADNQANHKEFCNRWIRQPEVMGRGKINLFDILDNFECSK